MTCGYIGGGSVVMHNNNYILPASPTTDTCSPWACDGLLPLSQASSSVTHDPVVPCGDQGAKVFEHRHNHPGSMRIGCDFFRMGSSGAGPVVCDARAAPCLK